jgi:hypothetical protein
MAEGGSGLADDILVWMRQQPGPVLFSAMARRFGSGSATYQAFDLLIRERLVTATFPEAKPGDSGRQFWRPQS